MRAKISTASAANAENVAVRAYESPTPPGTGASLISVHNSTR